LWVGYRAYPYWGWSDYYWSQFYTWGYYPYYYSELYDVYYGYPYVRVVKYYYVTDKPDEQRPVGRRRVVKGGSSHTVEGSGSESGIEGTVLNTGFRPSTFVGRSRSYVARRIREIRIRESDNSDYTRYRNSDKKSYSRRSGYRDYTGRDYSRVKSSSSNTDRKGVESKREHSRRSSSRTREKN
ncbi:MAG: hypothetical protein ACE5QV_06295, partial [Fidelibacterota bacterium]